MKLNDELVHFQRLEPELKAVWLYIASYIHKHSYSPTLQEIVAAVIPNKSRASARRRIDRLARMGYVKKKPEDVGKNRAYSLFVWPPVDRLYDVGN